MLPRVQRSLDRLHNPARDKAITEDLLQNTVDYTELLEAKNDHDSVRCTVQAKAISKNSSSTVTTRRVISGQLVMIHSFHKLSRTGTANQKKTQHKTCLFRDLFNLSANTLPNETQQEADHTMEAYRKYKTPDLSG